MRYFLFLIAPMLLIAGAANAATSIADCEKITAPDTYNQCLASFGPKRGQQPRASAHAGNPENSVPPGVRASANKAKQMQPHSRLSARRGKNGRASLQFIVPARSARNRK